MHLVIIAVIDEVSVALLVNEDTNRWDGIMYLKRSKKSKVGSLLENGLRTGGSIY